MSDDTITIKTFPFDSLLLSWLVNDNTCVIAWYIQLSKITNLIRVSSHGNTFQNGLSHFYMKKPNGSPFYQNNCIFGSVFPDL